MLAQKALAHYKGTSFEKPLHAAFQKISDGLRDRISFSWEDLDLAISFRGIGNSVGDIHLFEAVSRAALTSSELEFEYRKLEGGKI